MQAFFSNKINKILSEENFKKIFKIEVYFSKNPYG